MKKQLYLAQDYDPVQPPEASEELSTQSPTEVADSSQVDVSEVVNFSPPFVVAEADSAYRAVFAGQPSVLRKWAKPQSSLWKQFTFPYAATQDEGFPAYLDFIPKEQRHLYATHTVQPSKDGRYIGDTAVYHLGHDDIIVPVLLLSLFLMMWISVVSRHFLHEQIKEFFHTRLRKNLFDNPANSILRGRFWLILQSSLLLGILYVDYLQEQPTDYFSFHTPVVFLLGGSAVCYLYFVVQYLIFFVANRTFFAPLQNNSADNAYFTALLLQSYVLLPLALFSVFFRDQLLETQIVFWAVIAFIKLLFGYKLYRIFFPSLIGQIHLFLYFCALEISPLCLLGIGLSAMTHWLTH